MSLHYELKLYLKKHVRIIDRARYIQHNISPRWMNIYATEALISETWQLWNTACKNILIKSCQGCSGRSGKYYPKRPNTDNSVARIAYEVKQYGRNQQPQNGKITTAFWNEPTWGDGKKIITVIKGLNPNNTQELTTAFGLPLFGHVQLQALRNHLFHKDPRALEAVKKLPCFYGKKIPQHPCYLIWEYCNNSNSFFFYEWLNDMKHIIYQATS